MCHHHRFFYFIIIIIICCKYYINILISASVCICFDKDHHKNQQATLINTICFILIIICMYRFNTYTCSYRGALVFHFLCYNELFYDDSFSDDNFFKKHISRPILYFLSIKLHRKSLTSLFISYVSCVSALIIAWTKSLRSKFLTIDMFSLI